MLRQPRSDQYLSLGIALSMHIALGCALLLAARTGVTAPTVVDSDAGKAMVVQLVPVERPAPLRAANAAKDSPTLAFTHPGQGGGHPLGKEAPSERPVTTSPLIGVADARSDAAPSADVQTRAMADLPSAEILAFRARLQAHLARFRLYPAEAKDAGRQGVVFLHFTMNREGDVTQAWVETSSGVGAIDHEAVDAVRRAVPLPPLPSGFPDTLDIRLPVSFKLG